MDFHHRIAANAASVETHLNAYLDTYEHLPVVDAMRYAVQGGKRMRAYMVIESGAMFGISMEQSIWPAAAIEAVHAYSLVHDDMPCMDDDDIRRGRPTVHNAWDEATAVLAGDALQTMGFELVLNGQAGSPDVRAELAKTLAKASGAHGMVLGQALDIAAETAETPLTLEQIEHLQNGDITPLSTYAKAVGLAFQIADDILDVEGDEAKTGKRLNKDADAGKATFVSLLGLDGAKQRARALVDQAEEAISCYGNKAQNLQDVARFAISREN
ncbi:MAG: polyprenyl synthetase family protein [Rhodobacteraceae bacterium]|nr:polyprenyl synthetase family protein [Paracoccaceae bacterium]